MIPGNLIKLDPLNPKHVNGATSLTLALFAESPAGKLGEFFLKNFYFSCLPKLGLIDCLLYEVGGKFIGFIVYTALPYTFIKTGTNAHFFRLALTVAYSMLLKPSRILAVLNVKGQDNWRRTAEQDPGLCEMLTFGVLPQFRKQADRETGKRISRRIFESALEDMLNRDKERCLLVVSKENVLVNGFYAKYQTRRLLKDYSNPLQELWVFDLDRSRWVVTSENRQAK